MRTRELERELNRLIKDYLKEWKGVSKEVFTIDFDYIHSEKIKLGIKLEYCEVRLVAIIRDDRHIFCKAEDAWRVGKRSKLELYRRALSWMIYQLEYNSIKKCWERYCDHMRDRLRQRPDPVPLYPTSPRDLNK